MNKKYNYSIRAFASKIMLTTAFALLSYVTALTQVSAYTFGSAAGTYTPLSAGRSIIGCGTSGIFDHSTTVNIPFTFYFDKSCYTQVHISANGFAAFGNKNQFNFTSPISSTTLGYSATSFAVASPFGRDLNGLATGELSYEVLGIAPNRQFVVQWDDVQNGPAAGRSYDFQLVLNEGGGVYTAQTVQFVYGTFVGLAAATTAQVGLRGQNNTQFNNRATAANWAATTAGGTNTASCTVTTAVIPASGLTFTYSPAALACIAPSITRVEHTSTTTADVHYDDSCSPMPGIAYVMEYGPLGYAPGVGAAAGAGGTLAVLGGSPYALTSATGVDIYLRRECTPGVYSANSLLGKFNPNDECGSAQVIDCTNNAGAGYAASTVGYTVGASELPGHCGAAAGTQYGTFGLSRWYKIVGSDQNVTAALCGTAFGSDSRLTVYLGSCGNFTCVTGNDDCGPTFESTVTFTAVSGNDYYILLHHFSAGGTVTAGSIMNVACSAACSPGDTNDSDASPQALTLGVAFPDNNECASAGSVPNNACGGAFSSLLDDWYTFTSGAVTDHALVLSSIASPAPQADGPIYYAVYTANPCGGYNFVSCGSTTPNSANPLTLTPATNYYLRVYASTDDAGFYVLGNFDITMAAITCPQPSDLGAIPGDDNAYLFWTSNTAAPTWDVEYGLTGFAPTGTPTFSGTYPQVGIIASGLTASTGYEYYVRDNCGPGDDSFWSGPFAFTTASGVLANDGVLDAAIVDCTILADTVFTTTVGSAADSYPGDCGAGGASPQTGIWYRYVGDNQEVTIELCGSSYDTRLTVYQEDAGDVLTCVTGNDDYCFAQSHVSFNAYLGTDYLVFVHGFAGTGAVSLSGSCDVLCLPVPANDLCANVNTLAVGAGVCTSTAGSTSCATSSAYGNPGCLDNFFGTYGDVWYNFVATDASHDVRIDLGTSTDIVIDFFFEPAPPISDCTTDLASFGCLEWSALNNPSGSDVQITGMTPGETIWLRVLSEETEEGSFDICVWENPCPFPTAFILSNVTTSAFDLTWQENGTATQWDVYYGVAPVSPAPDDLTVPTVDNTTNPTTISGLTDNTAYNVWVRSDNPGQSCTSVWVGPFTITTLPNPPANDLCANAIPITCGNSYSSNTIAGTTDGETGCTYGQPVTNPGIWYTYAGDGSVVTIDMSNSNYDSGISVYTGICGGPHTCVAGDDDSGTGLTSLVSFQSIPGVDYLIYVHGWEFSGTAAGLVEFDVTCTAPIPGDFPANAVAISAGGGSAYPGCNTITTDYSGLTNSPQNTWGLGGPDKWYSVTTYSSALQIELTGAATDDVIQLFDATATTQIDVEDIGFVNADTEIMNIDGLTPLTTYLICISDWNGVGGPVTLCVRQLKTSTCADGAGSYQFCSNFKPTFTGANLYTFNFTPTSFAGPVAVGSSTSQIPISSLAPSIQYGESYDVSIDGTFNLLNGQGGAEVLNVPGSNIPACAVSIAAHPDAQVKLSQRCPATVLKNSIISAKPFVCGVVDWTVVATELNGCAGTPTGLPITGTTVGSSATINLNQINVGGTIQGGGKWYSLVWTPNFSYGPGTAGTARVINVVGAVSPEEQIGQVEEERFAFDVEAALYPNPNAGDMVYLNLDNVESNDVYVNITDMNGRIVYTERFIVDGSLNTIVTFAKPLANGVYNVQFIMGDQVITERMSIQK